MSLIAGAADYTDADCNAVNAMAVIDAIHGMRRFPRNLKDFAGRETTLRLYQRVLVPNRTAGALAKPKAGVSAREGCGGGRGFQPR